MQSPISILAVLALATFAGITHAQSNLSGSLGDLTGTPSYTIYEPEGIGPNSRINDMSIDSLGRIVLASESSLLTFDGTGWITYHNANPKKDEPLIIYSIVLGRDQVLYCTANTGIFEIEFGANRSYGLKPIPIPASESPANTHSFRESFVSDRYVYFYGQSEIGRIDTLTRRYESLTKDSGQAIGSAAVHDQRLYVFGVDGRVFLHISEHQWVEIKRTEKKGFDEGIRTATNWPGKALLAGPDTSGIYRLEDRSLVPWETEINQLDSHRVLAIAPISSSHFAASIDTNGVFVIDEEGKIVQVLSHSLDYRLGKIRRLVHVGNGTIWGAGGRTIVRIDFMRPLTNYDVLMPYAVTFPRVFWHEKILHVISDTKLVRAVAFEGNALWKYEQVAAQLKGIHNAKSVEEGIMICTESGIHLLREGGTIEPISDIESTLLVRNPAKPDLILSASSEKYRLLKRENGIWKTTEVSAPSPGNTFFGVVGSNDTMWLENGVGKVSKVSYSPSEIEIETFELGDYFYKNWVNIWKLDGRILFSPGVGHHFIEWDEQINGFKPIPEEHINNLNGKYSGIARPAMDTYGNIWVPSNSIHPVLRLQKDDTYKLDTHPLSAVQNDNLMHAIPGEKGNMWFIGENSILRYEAAKDNRQSSLPKTQVYSLELVKNRQLYRDPNTTYPSQPLEFDFSENNIIVNFTTPTIDIDEHVRHEYRIPGYIEDWTATQSPQSIEFDNLHEGDYKIEIRAVTDEGRFNEPSSVEFRVLPPTYRSPFAMASYGLGAIIGITLITLLTRKIAEEKNLRLQRLVDLRTRELGMANSELQQLVIRAESATTAKTAFLENISHEMRTPLNQILGPTSLLLNESEKPDEKETLTMVNEAAVRMLQMVEKITSFSENASNSSPSESTTFDIFSLVDDLYEKYKIVAEERNLDFTKHLDPKLNHYWTGDVSRIRHVLNILLENAFKFTDTGAVGISVFQTTTPGTKQKIRFEISDTGIGINTKMKEKIFEPFNQEQPSKKAKHEGTGIGLALCRQLVATLNGQIEVESIEGLGTVFRVFVPLGSRLVSKSQA